MQTLLLVLVTSGLVVLQSTKGQAEQTDRCSYAGVVHLEGNGRYSLNLTQAVQLCRSLGYSLATEEQLSKAYDSGLKTCRYGWIEGGKVSTLPYSVDPDCTPHSTGFVFYAEKEKNRYDVYCFSQSELSCKSAISSTPESVSSQPAHSQLTTTGKPDPVKDVLDEVIADGFIVDDKRTTPSVKNERSKDTSTTSNSLYLEGNPSQSLQKDNVTAVTKLKDPEVTTVDPNVGQPWSTKEVPKSDLNLNLNLTPVQENSEGTTPQTADFGITKSSISMKLTTEETINERKNTNIEGSGMFPETLHENNNVDLFFTTVRTRMGGLHTTAREAENGSGMDPEVTTSNGLTPDPNIIEEEASESGNILEKNNSNTETKAEAPIQPKGRINNVLAEAPEPTISAQVEEGTPGWLIIFAFCMTLGAILCVFAAIATKDKWYGPRRQSLNITPPENNEEYGKTATLPLSEKEQELVTLMKVEKNDFTAISLEEAPEKEYLM